MKKTAMMASLATILLLCQQATAGFNALNIGVNCGNDTNERLKCPFNRDAVVMHKMLKANGAKSKLLYGDQATYDNVLKALKKMAKRSKPGDVNFILLSAHGSKENGDYVAYLYNEDYIEGSEIVEITAQMKGTVIIAVDTCHAGLLLKHKTADNVIIFAACKEHQGASWVKPLSSLPKNEPCGYLSRPLFNVLARSKCQPKVADFIKEIQATEIPDESGYDLFGLFGFLGRSRVAHERQEPVWRVPNPNYAFARR